MTRLHRLQPLFVEEIPTNLDEGKLYISIPYDTITHLCACGCGCEVVTPLHPAQWRLTYDGEAASLFPSVGSWGLPCRSHYIVRDNQVLWARTWSDDEVRAVRESDCLAIEEHYLADERPGAANGPEDQPQAERQTLLQRLWRRFSSGTRG
ncbi:hypothetical protein LRS13_09425 [Svornostia abyssi]|uniref:Uncharacterized protein n=1 Tax=Svornostia abyssi TaxID=2898438 RepID=A0ABY5PMT8_9ACTN|nr:hypothetical protein LRS13_09425 [Parviterribacteraceae bacterium J379]